MKSSFVMTKDLIKEAQKVFMKQSLSNIILNVIETIIALFGVGFIVVAIVDDKVKAFFYAGVLFFFNLLYYLQFKQRLNSSVKLTYERSLFLNNGKEAVANYEFTNNAIIINYVAEGGTRKLPYSSIIKVIETNLLFVLIFENKLILSVKKDSFIDCYNDDFINFISQKCKVKLQAKTRRNRQNAI